VRLAPGIPDTSGSATVVVTNSGSNHTDDVGVYLALLPPGGSSNPGGCSPATVINLGVFSLLPGGRISIKIDPPWLCTNPAAVDGMNWTLKAIADVHGDDFASCATLDQVFDSVCSLAISDDDDNGANDFRTRARPIVVSLAP
jgi:hypothetical protein